MNRTLKDHKLQTEVDTKVTNVHTHTHTHAHHNVLTQKKRSKHTVLFNYLEIKFEETNRKKK